MLKSLLTAVAAATALSGCVTAQEESANAQIMILGRHHFSGGHDFVNQEVDDYLGDKRQAEIADVLDRLEQFAPTVIAVENEPHRQEALDERYAAYRAGDRELTANEIEQIGFALAARLDLPGVVAVDYVDGMDFEAIMNAAQAAGQQALLQKFQQTTAAIGAVLSKIGTPDTPVIDQLRFHNSEELAAFHDGYLTLAQMGTADNPVGAIEMSRWWTRNLRIYANIARASNPGDRVLVIYGSGHKFLLDQYIDDSASFTLVSALDYLN